MNKRNDKKGEKLWVYLTNTQHKHHTTLQNKQSATPSHTTMLPVSAEERSWIRNTSNMKQGWSEGNKKSTGRHSCYQHETNTCTCVTWNTLIWISSVIFKTSKLALLSREHKNKNAIEKLCENVKIRTWKGKEKNVSAVWYDSCSS